MQTGNSRYTAEQLDLARKQLDRILTSNCFRRSERLRRLLSYIAENSLFSDAFVTEYAIAVHVFDRDETFDTRRDAIVRVEARRLRSKLLEYYATEGANAPVTLDLQVGSYILLFRRCVPAISGTQSETVTPKRSVLVQPFSALGESTVDRLHDELMTELLNELAQIEDLRILLRDTLRSRPARGEDPAAEGIGSQADWIVGGALHGERTIVRASVRVINARDWELKWARSWDLPQKPALALLESIAGSAASAIRSLHSEAATVEGLRRPPDRWSPNRSQAVLQEF